MTVFIGLWYSAWIHFTVSCYTQPVSTVTSSLPLLGSGLQRWTFRFLWVLERCPCLSYQPLTATAHNDWTAAVLWRAPIKVTFKVRVTLRRAVYRQSVHLGAKPLEAHDHRFFQLNPCGHSPYATSFLTRGWVCLLWVGFVFVKWTYRTCSTILKILPCVLHTNPLSVQALESRSCLSYLSYATTAA
jgi:hypothetical protein